MSFWRTEDPEVDAAGSVQLGGMWEHQRTWWDLPNFVKLLVTGYGGGKTNVLCKRMIAQALHNAPAPAAIVSPTFPLARETVIVTCQELLDGKQSIHGHDFSWHYNKSDHVFHIRYGSVNGKLIIYSGDHPDRLKGPNLGPVGIDEPFIQDYAVFKQMIARIRHPKAKMLELVCTGTPESLNWGYELAEGELRGDHDVGMVQASTMDNLANPAGYSARLEGQFAEKERAAFVHGQFVNMSSGQVYYAFDPARNVVDAERDPFSELGAGMDFGSARGYASMASVSFWTDGHRMHVFDAEEQANSDTPAMCTYLRELHARKDGRPGCGLRDIYPDATGQARQSATGDTDFQALWDAGFEAFAHPANPERRERYNRVNALFETGQLTIAPHLRKLKQYLVSYTHEEMHKQKQMSHLLDALGYPVCYLFPGVSTRLEASRIM